MSYAKHTFEEIAYSAGILAGLYTERVEGPTNAFKWVEQLTIEVMQKCVNQGANTSWKDCRKVVDITPVFIDYDLPINYVLKEGMYFYNLEANVIRIEQVSDLENDGKEISLTDIEVGKGYLVAPSQNIRVTYYYFHPNMTLTGALYDWVLSLVYLMLLQNKRRSHMDKSSARRDAEINKGLAFQEALTEIRDLE